MTHKEKYTDARLWLGEMALRSRQKRVLLASDDPPHVGFFDTTDESHHLIHIGNLAPARNKVSPKLWEYLSSAPGRQSLLTLMAPRKA